MCIVFAELKLNAAARAELREGREVCRVPPWSAVPRTGRRRQCAPDASVAPGREAHALGRTGATSCTAGGDETRKGRPLHPDVARLDWLCSSRSWPGAACARMSLRPRGSRTVFRASSVPALQWLKGRGERWLSPEVGRQASYCLRCRFSAAERSDQVLLCESRDVQAIKAHGCRGLRLFSAWI